MANLQVKSIDDDLYKSLGKRAAMENRSISQEVVSILKDYLSTPSNKFRQVNINSWNYVEAGKEKSRQMN